MRSTKHLYVFSLTSRIPNRCSKYSFPPAGVISAEEPTEKQISILPKNLKLDFNLTRYEASSHITFEFNKEKIKKLIKAN